MEAVGEKKIRATNRSAMQYREEGKVQQAGQGSLDRDC